MGQRSPESCARTKERTGKLDTHWMCSPQKKRKEGRKKAALVSGQARDRYHIQKSEGCGAAMLLFRPNGTNLLCHLSRFLSHLLETTTRDFFYCRRLAAKSICTANNFAYATYFCAKGILKFSRKRFNLWIALWWWERTVRVETR